MRVPEPAGQLAQIVPALAFAVPYIVAGAVDMATAGASFRLALGVAVAVRSATLALGVVQNPISWGVDLWLVVGAAAFSLPGLEPLAGAFGRLQAITLFATVLPVGILTTFLPGGFLGDGTRRQSLALLALAAVALGWSVALGGSIRLGGGLPFILLNVARQVLRRRGDAAHAGAG